MSALAAVLGFIPVVLTIAIIVAAVWFAVWTVRILKGIKQQLDELTSRSSR